MSKSMMGLPQGLKTEVVGGNVNSCIGAADIDTCHRIVLARWAEENTLE